MKRLLLLTLAAAHPAHRADETRHDGDEKKQFKRHGKFLSFSMWDSLHGNECTLEFRAQGATLGKVCLHRINRSLRMILTLAPIFARDALFGDKDRGVTVPGLQLLIAHKHLLDAMSGWIFDLDVGVETETAFDITTHLVVRIACKRSLQVFLQHRDNFLARQLDR